MMEERRPWVDMTYWDYCVHAAPGCIDTFPGGEADADLDAIDRGKDALFRGAARRYDVERSEAYISLAAARLILESVLAPDAPDSGVIRLLPEESERLKTHRIRLDGPPNTFDAYVKRPYYRMRGAPVSEEQAFEIVRRTDGYIRSLLWRFRRLAEDPAESLVETCHFDEQWFDERCFPGHHGWAHPSGVIGIDDHTARWPTCLELLEELLRFQRAFPFLDLVAAFTWWDEVPDSVRDAGRTGDVTCSRSDFLENVVYGVWLRGDAIEFLGRDRAIEKYVEYDGLYGQRDPGVYVPELCAEKSPVRADRAYLRRCIAAFGIEPDLVLPG